MSVMVTTGASLMCPFGIAPGMLTVTSQVKCLASGKPIATIKDTAFPANLSGFGMCTSLANPQVAAATAAALGVLTPQPCQPAAAGPWVCIKKTFISNIPCLGNDGILMCTKGAGMISIVSPGQIKVLVD